MLETRVRGFGGSGASDTSSLVQNSRNVNTVYPISGGGDLTVDRILSVDTLFLVNTGRSINTTYPLSGGGDFSLNRIHLVDTAFLINSGRTISTGMGLSGGGNLSSDRTFVADTNLLVTTGKSIVTVYPLSGGGDFSVNRTHAIDTAFLVNTGRSISTVYPISGGGNFSLDRSFALDTAFLVNSNRTLTVQTGLTGGGNLGIDRTIGISTANATVGQYMIVSGGTALGGIAWINTAGAGSSVVYAATGNTYIVTDLAGDLTNEFRLVQSGNSITISTAGNLITINAVTNGGSSVSQTWIPNGFTSFTNGYWIDVQSSNIGSGITTLYTTPNGRKSIMFSRHEFNITTTTLVTSFIYTVSGNAYYISLANRAFGQETAVQGPMLILNSGDKIQYYASSDGLFAQAQVYEFDSADNVFMAFINPASGNNTLYTCPSNRRANVLKIVAGNPLTNFQGALISTNSSGSTRNYIPYFVKSGGAIGPLYQIGTNANSNNNGSFQIGTYMCSLSNGDSIAFFCDSGSGLSQGVFACITEV